MAARERNPRGNSEEDAGDFSPAVSSFNDDDDAAGSTGTCGDDFVVASPQMRRLMSIIAKIARSDATVLLVGETGVGKGSLARRLHECSERKAARFFRADCTTLSETLIAPDPEAAPGGTVLIDDVSDLSVPAQARLLAALESNAVTHAGTTTVTGTGLRFLATTHRDLSGDVRAGLFRADLYYRLATVTLHIPPLRDRNLDIEPLARLFLERACERYHRQRVPGLAGSALTALHAYNWPGNVRELRNVMERTVLLGATDVIDRDTLWIDDVGAIERKVGTSDTRARAEEGQTPAERDRIRNALQTCHGNQTQAAKLLGISRRTLVARLAELDLPRPRKSFPSPARGSRSGGSRSVDAVGKERHYGAKLPDHKT